MKLFSAYLSVAPFRTMHEELFPVLILLAVICAALVLCSLALTLLVLIHKNTSRNRKILLPFLYIATVLTVVCSLYCFRQYRNATDSLEATLTTVSPETTTPTETAQQTEPPTQPPTQPPTNPPTEPPRPPFTPAMTEDTDPDNWDITWRIMDNGEKVDSYQRQEPISFGEGSAYTALEGIIAFRGDNYRSGATYGTANITEETISTLWKRKISNHNGWTGSGWTGQPLIVRWDDATKAIMNLYPDKKAKEGLVEVIYATLDGHVYFYDLDDGTYTRDPLYLGMNFKGAGCLDPRGYPLMYVGSGDYVNDKSPRMYVISLIDTTVLYERSGGDSFALRNWGAFDAGPLVSAETDTLIWGGENGILYTIKLNTVYDQTAGTISVTPDNPVKTRYTTKYDRWLGYECSPVIVDHYLYASENGGMFFCVDLNTMELVWAQNTRDDSNSTPVFEWGEDGRGYIYTAPSLHWTADSSHQGWVSIYKLDAQTGQIVWEYKYDCNTVPDVSGGVQSTPLLGKKGTDLEGLIVYSIARTPNTYNGRLVAFDTETGEIAWEMSMRNYTWSSPVALYTDAGKSYIVVGDSVGNIILVDGATGTRLHAICLDYNIESSPAVFGDTLVLGTRGEEVYALKIN